MARDLAEALELARRVRANVEQTRARARDAGVPGAETLAADVYDLAAWVLGRSAAQEHTAIAALRRISGHLAPLVAEMSTLLPLMSGDPEASSHAREGRPCASQHRGPGMDVRRGGSGEYDPPCGCRCHETEESGSCECMPRGAGKDAVCGSPARPCRCACHERATSEPDVDPRQLAIPGCEPPPAQEAAPAPPEPPPAPARRRAEEQDVAIEDWEPDPVFLSSLQWGLDAFGQDLLEDTARVRERLAEFKKEKAGQKAKRWPSVFRSWLAKQRGQPSGDRSVQEMP